MTALTPEQKVANTEALQFTNARGENIDASLILFTDPERGAAWLKWAEDRIPTDVFTTFGLIGAEGSKEWRNLVEHSAFVAAGSRTLANQLKAAGLKVDVDLVERAAWVHDAAKPAQVAAKMSREAEVSDLNLKNVLGSNGYSEAEIAAAENTGRLADRYLKGDELAQAIAGRSIEENIVGYVDARTRGSLSMSVEQARADSIEAKPKDVAFFNDNWEPYYRAVEEHFAQQMYPEYFDQTLLNNESIFATVQQQVELAA